MGVESGGENKVKDTIDAVTGLVTAVPIYQDMAQPAAKELGKSLETLGRAINVALYPLSGMVWGFEQIKGFLETKLASNLKDVPPENIIPPKPNVAGPAIEALRFTGHEESLSDMYANLLATAMDKNTADGAHPAFVEIIKQLTPDEAKLIAYFIEPKPFPLLTVRSTAISGGGGFDIINNFSLFGVAACLELPDLVPTYLDNLSRLGLISIPESYTYTRPNVYDGLENDPVVMMAKQFIDETPDRKCEFVRGAVVVTNLGKQFGSVCVKTKE